MQMVIEISDIAYSNIKKLVSLNCGICTDIEKAIANGTPLPKSYGDLIDRNELLKQPLDDINYPSNYVRIAPVIIPATERR